MLKKAVLPKGKPIVFKDGKKVDFSSVNDQWIDGDILKEEMKYISRMTEGLATGTMVDDKEYSILKNKVVKEMIDEKVVTIKKRLCEMAKKKSSIYDHAKVVQDETLRAYQNYAEQVAKDNTIEIYFDEMTGEYKINRSPLPVSLRRNHANVRSYQWHTIDLKDLKAEIQRRGEGIGESHKPSALDSDILKEVEGNLKDQGLEKLAEKINEVTKKKETKKTKKKVAKKTISKKKTVTKKKKRGKK